MAATLSLTIIDLSAQDHTSMADSIRQACTQSGFFYVINHGVEQELLAQLFDQSRKFFSLPLEQKMALARKEHRGYSPLYAEKLDPASNYIGDSKESFYVGPLEDAEASKLNQWPAEETLPNWRSTMVTVHRKFTDAGKRLMSLIALSLNLNEEFFEKAGALVKPSGFLRLLHYPGDMGIQNEEIYGASAHSDYGMITLLATDGVQGLQICREKFNQPQVWENVPHLDGAFIINIGDMMERWTNCLYRSTLHRVMPIGKERYSVAFFLDPNDDCVVECLESCCSNSCPPRFPPIRSGDYFKEKFRLTYGS